MAYISPRLKTIYTIVNLLEEKCVTKADVLITVSETMLSSFRTKPERVSVIMNCSDYNTNSIDSWKKKNSQQESFTLLYLGTIVRGRGLEEISKAMEGLNKVELVIAGHIIDKKLLEALLRLPNIRYEGLLKYQEAIDLIHNSNVLMVLYDPEVPNNRFSYSNKLFEGMMCGLPIITNVSSDIVKDEVDCGVLVDYYDINQIKSAIITLRNNPELRKKLGYNGRQAFLRKYNWKNMERKLFEVYQSLIPQMKTEGVRERY